MRTLNRAGKYEPSGPPHCFRETQYARRYQSHAAPEHLQLEYDVIKSLRKAMSVCETEHDYQTRDTLKGMLADTEEDHAYWLERQLGLIEKIGLENYLQSQI